MKNIKIKTFKSYSETNIRRPKYLGHIQKPTLEDQ